jgi:putative flippase GtrA
MDNPPRRLTGSFGRFIASGAIGFLVDALVLTAFMRSLHLGAIAARAVSFPAAVTVTWLLNRHGAFAGRGLANARHEYAGYFAIQLVGAALNLLVFVACLESWPALAEWPVIALAAGAAIALLFNFFAARLMLYSRLRPPP